jgi:hypothetical protein
MAGVGPLGSPNRPQSLRRADKDGGGGGSGGRYVPNRRQPDEEQQPDEDRAELSAAVPERLSHIKPMQPAAAQPDSADARQHILAEIQHFNETPERLGSRLHAVLKPTVGGSKLVVEDAGRGVTMQPFGEADIYHVPVPMVRTRLEAFDRSRGNVFDGRA